MFGSKKDVLRWIEKYGGNMRLKPVYLWKWWRINDESNGSLMSDNEILGIEIAHHTINKGV